MGEVGEAKEAESGWVTGHSACRRTQLTSRAGNVGGFDEAYLSGRQQVLGSMGDGVRPWQQPQCHYHAGPHEQGREGN
jgi:hypothetical protein